MPVSHEDIESTDDASLAVLDARPAGHDERLSHLPARSRRPVVRNRLKSSSARSATSRPITLRDRFPHGVSWPMTAWMAGMHLGAIAALWYFSWAGFALFIGLHFVTACL